MTHARPLGNLVLLFFFQEKKNDQIIYYCYVVFVLARLHCIVIRELIMSLPKFVSWSGQLFQYL